MNLPTSLTAFCFMVAGALFLASINPVSRIVSELFNMGSYNGLALLGSLIFASVGVVSKMGLDLSLQSIFIHGGIWIGGAIVWLSIS